MIALSTNHVAHAPRSNTTNDMQTGHSIVRNDWHDKSEMNFHEHIDSDYVQFGKPLNQQPNTSTIDDFYELLPSLSPEPDLQEVNMDIDSSCISESSSDVNLLEPDLQEVDMDIGSDVLDENQSIHKNDIPEISEPQDKERWISLSRIRKRNTQPLSKEIITMWISKFSCAHPLALRKYLKKSRRFQILLEFKNQKFRDEFLEEYASKSELMGYYRLFFTGKDKAWRFGKSEIGEMQIKHVPLNFIGRADEGWFGSSRIDVLKIRSKYKRWLQIKKDGHSWSSQVSLEVLRIWLNSLDCGSFPIRIVVTKNLGNLMEFQSEKDRDAFMLELSNKARKPYAVRKWVYNEKNEKKRRRKTKRRKRKRKTKRRKRKSKRKHCREKEITEKLEDGQGNV